MKTTELDIYKILKAVDSESQSVFSKREELFTFKGRPVEAMNIFGKENSCDIYFYDGTVSRLDLMDTGELRGEVVINEIDEEALINFVKKFNSLGGKQLTYAPNVGTTLNGKRVVEVTVLHGRFFVSLENDEFTERYLV